MTIFAELDAHNSNFCAMASPRLRVFDEPPQPLTTVAPPINGTKFLAYLEQVLVPTLSPGEIVMMDSSQRFGGVRGAPHGSDKRAGVRRAIEAAGAARCFLPAYSPDSDPIEEVFAKLKNTLRKMARRTVDAPWDDTG